MFLGGSMTGSCISDHLMSVSKKKSNRFKGSNYLFIQDVRKSVERVFHVYLLSCN